MKVSPGRTVLDDLAMADCPPLKRLWMKMLLIEKRKGQTQKSGA
jgi:hypothetical protein